MDKIVIGAIILAAGSSSRLGSPKQEVSVEGKPLLLRTVEAVSGACNGPVMVVLGAQAERFIQLLAPVHRANIHVVMNHDWKVGMGSSIAHGMVALNNLRLPVDAVLLSVCDQPRLNTELLLQLVEKLRQAPDRIVASSYSGILGPPVLFPETCFPSLQLCSGDTGARHILRQNEHILDSIDFHQLAWDIDAPEDLYPLKNKTH